MPDTSLGLRVVYHTRRRCVLIPGAEPFPSTPPEAQGGAFLTRRRAPAHSPLPVAW